MTNDLFLREATQNDLPTFFENQLNSEANEMVASLPRDWEAFLAHWIKILGDKSVTIKTILFLGKVAGYIMVFEHSGKQELGYWIGKNYWGQGLATRALSDFLQLFSVRPLYASVAKHNHGSMRVLEKCGFKIVGEDKEFANIGGEVVEGCILALV